MDSTIFQALFNGLAVGSIIALAAVGLTLTMGILRLSNFAHGDFLTVGAYLTWWINHFGLNIWLSMAIALLGTILIMLAGEQLLWKPLRKQKASSTSLIIVSIGLALFLRNGILFIWGGSNQNYDLPLVEALDFGGLKIAYYRLIVIIVTILAIVGLHLVLQKTKIGKGMRAVADNIDLARVSGINVEQIVLFTWVLTAILTATGGGLYGLITAVRPNMGWFLILPIFASVILGGIGNVYGAIAGGLIIGVAQELSVFIVGSEYKLGVALLIMIVILLVRPQGIFGK
ncbi:branched-chain amino acid ABC transporter permease [Cyanobacterium aponinum UTEX 3222]|uniref:Branched-chain amino acid ABC transporter permease n=1 Tax=Cyanobacterium aponinum AL20115 TaxID=3090662 RepID=A0AAF1C603_9CHRO|nr:branched-chain amino acid ABC transporter permease [Cyanobacterium aponinum]WPF89936.1 branched-chain amino acid ABC transporter permease [Cyanobacterium aponinum AL20115]WRL41130.1 branched-chain amino acid ABC transporter permease [Cyanobacterium aponinum UTEX 3222]